MPFTSTVTAAFMPHDVYYQPNYRQVPKQKACLEVPRANRL